MSFFAELPMQAKALIGGLLLVCVLALGANFLPRGGGSSGGGSSSAEGGTTPGHVVIYKHMEVKEAEEAAAVLKKAAYDVHITDDGTAISVPKERADDAKVTLATAGLPKEGVMGYSELFGDKPPGFISTDFEKRIALNRALNGELSRLIKKIDGVDGASVIVNMPEEQLFTEERKPTTATVMVRLQPNRTLDKSQVEGVQHLVASSVPGLKTSNVTVVGDTGKLLSDGMAENAGDNEDRLVAKALDRQMMLTHERETAVESKVQSLLDKLFGPGKSVVRVAIDLDFSQKKTKTILYAPPADARGNNAPSNRSVSSEKSSSGGGVGGAPGTTSNIPRVPTYPLEAVGGQGGVTERRSENTTYGQNSTNLTLTEDQVGTVKRLSVTALIQGLPAERVNAMTQIVTAAAGADIAGRGDQIVVQPVAFDTSQTDMLKQLLEQQEQAKAQASIKKKDGGIPTSWIIGVGAAFLVLFLLLAIIRLANRKEDTTDVLVNSLGDQGGLPAGFDPNALGGYPGMEMTGTVPMAGGEEGPFGFLEQMDPEMVADLLSQERPGTAAGILGLLNPGYADMVLQIMPPEMQEDLINRLQTQPQLPAFQQKTVAQQLKRRLGVPA